jgi:hypothetical protein
MVYRDDLKIEFKAVPYGSTGIYRRLMYRISPDQDLTYYKEYSFLGIKFKRKKKFDTSWQKGWQYLTWSESCGSEPEPTTNPILFNEKSIFEDWKRCKTMGEYFEKLDKINEKEIIKWKESRKKYLSQEGDWV